MRDFARENRIDQRLDRLEQELRSAHAAHATITGVTVAIHDVLKAIIRTHPDPALVQRALEELPEQQLPTDFHQVGYQKTMAKLRRSLRTDQSSTAD